MWFLELPIWTRIPPCGPAVIFEDSWILGNKEIFIQNITQRAGSSYIFPPPALFLVDKGLIGTGFLGLILWTTLSGQSFPVSCAQVSEMPPVILEHCDKLGRNFASASDFGTHFLHLLYVFSLYKEYLVVQWDVAHLELMDSSETPLCGKTLKKKIETFVLVGILNLLYTLWILQPLAFGKIQFR